MTLDQRARTAADDVRRQVAIAEVPDAGVIARQARRRRGRRLGAGAAVVAMAAVALGLVAVRDEPAPPPAATDAQGVEGWERILKADAGIDAGAELGALASDGGNALVAGAAPDGDWWRTAIWFSEDGRTWVEADHPDLPGHVSAVAFHDGVALASGVSGVRDASYQSAFVWRSDDAGRTWQDLALAPDAFGPPAPQMGRPFVSQLLFRDGWWVAAGGSSTGYSGIWVSETGATWEQVLESREGGGPSLADLEDGGLLAYWTTVGWSTDDPTEWGPHFDVDAPGDLYPASIAAGADLAVGQGFVSHMDSALLRSADEGHSWQVDDAFDRRFPDAFLMGTARLGGVDVVAGADGEERPTAWLSVDGGPWTSMPEALRGPVGGTLGLITEVDGRIVLFGTAPELDRFYVATP